MKLFVGVDIGSTTAKCVIVDENDKMLVFSHIPTEYDRNVSGEKILKIALDEIGASESDIAYLVSTGYGRKSFERADLNIPEIIAHGMGTWHMMPGTRTIIDIGGQDSKVIELSEQGVVERFEMNDKCAAGTGRFFEVLTHRLLGIKMEELSDLMKKSKNACTISSMCTIFAESGDHLLPLAEDTHRGHRGRHRQVHRPPHPGHGPFRADTVPGAHRLLRRRGQQRGHHGHLCRAARQARNGGQDAPVHRGPRRRAQGPQGVRQAAERLRPANTTKREMRRS